MSFTLKFTNGSEMKADIIQEAVRNDSADNESVKRLIIKQNREKQNNEISEVESILRKEGNLSEISVYEGSEKIAVYTGYEQIDSIINTLQQGPSGIRFILDIQLSR